MVAMWVKTEGVSRGIWLSVRSFSVLASQVPYLPQYTESISSSSSGSENSNDWGNWYSSCDTQSRNSTKGAPPPAAVNAVLADCGAADVCKNRWLLFSQSLASST